MNKRVYSCHQPNFLPWIGYFNKILKSDCFVILDEVQYVKNSVANRNLIKTSNGSDYITVPVGKKVNNSSFFTYREAEIADARWNVKALKTIHQNYSKSRFFEDFIGLIERIFEIKSFCELNVTFIREMMNVFNIETQVLLMSDIIETSVKNNDLLIEIGTKIGGSIYLSGQGARKYNDIEKFKLNGINLEYQSYEPQVYEQMFLPFVSNLSILDLLFNEGENGAKYIDNC